MPSANRLSWGVFQRRTLTSKSRDRSIARWELLIRILSVAFLILALTVVALAYTILFSPYEGLDK